MLQSTTQNNQPAQFAHHAEVYVLIIAAISIFIVSIDMSMVSSTMPVLAASLHLDPAHASLILLSYYLALASAMIVFGRTSDVIGTIKMFMFGCLFFVLGSFFSGISTDLPMLVIFRFLQGIGGAMLLPIHGAIITKYVSPRHVGKFFGVVTFAAGAGYTLGFILGGIIAHHLSWRWIFFVNIPFGIIALWAAQKASETPMNIKHKPDAKNKIDYYGAAFIFITMLLFTYLLNQFNNMGIERKVTVFCISLVSLAMFILRTAKARNPIINLKIFGDYTLVAAIAAGLLINIIFDGFNFVNPFYLSIIKKLPPTEVGSVLAIFPITSMLVGPIAGYCSDKFGAHSSSLFASFLLLFAIILFYFFEANSEVGYILVALVFFGAAISLFFTANIKAVMKHAAPGEEGVVSSLRASASYFGGVVGFSWFAQILSHPGLGPVTQDIYLLADFKSACKIGMLLTCVLVMIVLSPKIIGKIWSN